MTKKKIALLAGCESMAKAKTPQQAMADPAGDVVTLNVALGLEQEAIAAYQLGAESNLLQKPVLEVAVLFQSHHKEHAGALEATIVKLGGFFFQAEDGIRDGRVTGVQTCALPI